MTSFYTRRGDAGQTGLLGKSRVYKDDLIIEVLGSIDELTSVLGLARSASQLKEIQEIVIHIQRDLFHLLGEVAAAPDHVERFNYVRPEHVGWLETRISAFEQKVKVPSFFILPGDSAAAGALDLARTVTRRAERNMVKLVRSGVLSNQTILQYLNRLSSLLFVMELYEIDMSGMKPTPADDTEKLPQ
jgi:cob(I)alamin adenosyltransferase